MVGGDTLTIHVQNLILQDEFAFPGAVRVPSSLSLDITYTKSGNPRKIRPNHDPISPFNWSGKMWMATNSGTFSVSHDDGSFSATNTIRHTSPAVCRMAQSAAGYHPSRGQRPDNYAAFAEENLVTFG